MWAKLRQVALWFGVTAAAYYLVSMGAYAFAHPELTNTQLYFHILNALLWQW